MMSTETLHFLGTCFITNLVLESADVASSGLALSCYSVLVAGNNIAAHTSRPKHC